MKKLFDTQSHSWGEVGLARQLSVRAVEARAHPGAVLVPVAGRRSSSSTATATQLFGAAYETPVRIAHDGRARRPRLGVARDVGRCARPDAVPADGPGDGRHRRLPHPPGHVGIAHHRRAARRRARPAHARRRRRVHRGHRRSRRAADARQPDRRDRAAQRAPVPGRRPRAAAGRRLAGQIEGVVSSLGLLYTTFAQGDDSIMVPNSVVLYVADRAAARARRRSTCARACAPASRRSDVQAAARRHASQTPIRDRAADRARGDRRRRGRRAHRGDAGTPAGRPAAGRRGPGRGRPRRATRRAPGAERHPSGVRAARGAAAGDELSAWSSAAPTWSLGDPLPPSLRLHRGGEAPGARPAPSPRRAGRPGRRRPRARLRSIARTTASATSPRASRCRRRAAASRRCRGTCPASRIEAGEDRATRRRRSGAGPRAGPARSRAGRTSSPSRPSERGVPTLPDSEDMKTRWPLRRATIASSRRRASTIGARRFTSSARSICSTVNEVEQARRRAGRRWRPARRRRAHSSPRRSTACGVGEVDRERPRRSRRPAARARRRAGRVSTRSAPARRAGAGRSRGRAHRSRR